MEAELSCRVAKTQDLEMGSPQQRSERATLSEGSNHNTTLKIGALNESDLWTQIFERRRSTARRERRVGKGALFLGRRNPEGLVWVLRLHLELPSP
jgi:hypothetical protein